jgi:hypothetical protein
MNVDAEKLEQAVLALLHLNMFDEKSGKRAWTITKISEVIAR